MGFTFSRPGRSGWVTEIGRVNQASRIEKEGKNEKVKTGLRGAINYKINILKYLN